LIYLRLFQIAEKGKLLEKGLFMALCLCPRGIMIELVGAK